MDQQDRGTCRGAHAIWKAQSLPKAESKYLKWLTQIPWHWPQMFVSGCKPRPRPGPAKRQLFPYRTEMLAASGSHTPGQFHGTSPGCLSQCKQIIRSQLHRPIHLVTADGLGISQTVLQPMSFPIWANVSICSAAAFSHRPGSGASSLPPPPSRKASLFTPLPTSGVGSCLFLHTIMHSTDTSIATRHMWKGWMPPATSSSTYQETTSVDTFGLKDLEDVMI